VPAVAAVRDPTQWPYVLRSDAPTLQTVLSQEWPHDAILEAYASVL
jgi:hypothetical protein